MHICVCWCVEAASWRGDCDLTTSLMRAIYQVCSGRQDHRKATFQRSLQYLTMTMTTTEEDAPFRPRRLYLENEGKRERERPTKRDFSYIHILSRNSSDDSPFFFISTFFPLFLKTEQHSLKKLPFRKVEVNLTRWHWSLKRYVHHQKAFLHSSFSPPFLASKTLSGTYSRSLEKIFFVFSTKSYNSKMIL